MNVWIVMESYIEDYTVEKVFDSEVGAQKHKTAMTGKEDYKFYYVEEYEVEQANELPTYNSLVIDLAFQKVVIEEQDKLIHYLKKQLEQARGAKAELALAEIRRLQRALWIIPHPILTPKEMQARYGTNQALIIIEPNRFLQGVQRGE